MDQSAAQFFQPLGLNGIARYANARGFGLLVNGQPEAAGLIAKSSDVLPKLAELLKANPLADAEEALCMLLAPSMFRKCCKNFPGLRAGRAPDSFGAEDAPRVYPNRIVEPDPDFVWIELYAATRSEDDRPAELAEFFRQALAGCGIRSMPWPERSATLYGRGAVGRGAANSDFAQKELAPFLDSLHEQDQLDSVAPAPPKPRV